MSLVDKLKLIAARVETGDKWEWHVAQSMTSARIWITLVAGIRLDGEQILGYQVHVEKTEEEWADLTPEAIECHCINLRETIRHWFERDQKAKAITTMPFYIDGEEYGGTTYVFEKMEWLT